MTAAAAVTAPGIAHASRGAAWGGVAQDLDNMAHALGRLHDMYVNRAFHDRFAAEARSTWRRAVEEQLHEPDRPRLTAMQWLPGGQVGDPFRVRWHEQGRGRRVPVAFHNRNGAKLRGHVWGPRHGTGRAPGVVIAPGRFQSTEVWYHWAAQGLAEAGYLVLTFDVQGQGRSDTLSTRRDGSAACTPDGCPTRQIDDFVHGTIDALEFLVSTPAEPTRSSATDHNPLWRWLDRSRIGIAGHSFGATATTIVQDVVNSPGHPEHEPFARRGIAPTVVDAVVAWDNVDIDPSITPRVPAMSQNAEYYAVPVPAPLLSCTGGPCTPSAPDPRRKQREHDRWRAAGIDAMQVVLRGSTHFEWAFIPYAMPASRKGERVAFHYTLAWFDRYLRHDSTSLRRLTLRRFDRSADRSSIGTGAYDERSGRNVPHRIGGDRVGDHLSVHFTSSWSFGGVTCRDMRAGCGAARGDFGRTVPNTGRQRGGNR